MMWRTYTSGVFACLCLLLCQRTHLKAVAMSQCARSGVCWYVQLFLARQMTVCKSTRGGINSTRVRVLAVRDADAESATAAE
jgi:hypothetical protein